MEDKNYPQIRRTGLVVQEMPDEILVYDLDANKAHCLNTSAAIIWRACDGSNSIADIVKTFEKTNRNKVTEDFVWLAINQLNANGLLQPGTTSRFVGQSRREVLKRIGLASMVALPVIASLAAPQSALASGSCACAPSGNLQSSFCFGTPACNNGGANLYCNCSSQCSFSPQTC